MSACAGDGLTRAEQKENTHLFCGQKNHQPDDSGSTGMVLAAWNLCAKTVFTHPFERSLRINWLKN
jgi:hypothetical protein